MKVKHQNVWAVAVVLLIAAVSFNANFATTDKSEKSEIVIVDESVESPCTDCIQNAQYALALCNERAGSDSAKQSACTTSAQNAMAQCNAGPCKY